MSITSKVASSYLAPFDLFIISSISWLFTQIIKWLFIGELPFENEVKLLQ